MPKALKIAAFFVAAAVSLAFGQPQLALFFGSLALGELLTPKAPGGFTTSRERQQSIREGAAVRKMAFGKVKVGADAHAIYDTNDDNEFMRLMVLNWGEIDSFETHYLNSEEVTLDGSNLVNNSTDEKWDGNVEIVTFLGSDAQTALSEAVTDYTPWTSAHRLRGCAGVYVKQSAVAASDSKARHLHQEIHYNGVVKASNQIYDPRDASTGWSDNQALILLWFFTHPDGRNRTLADADMDVFKAAADTCDEAVPLKAGGTEKRYRAWGQVALDDDPNDVIRHMLANMDATPYFTSAGKFAIQIGDIPVTADTTFTEGHIITTEFQAGPRAVDRYNRVLPVLFSEDHNFQEITAPAYEDAADVAANGAKTFRLDLPFCPSQTQGQRLAKKKLRRLNPDEQGVLTLNMAGLFARPGAAIKLGYANAETNADMRVSSREMSPEGTGVTLEVATIATDYGEWDETIDEKDLIALPGTSGSGALLAAPTGVNAVAVAININQATVGAGLKITWDSPADSTIDAQVEASIDGSGNWFGRQLVEANQAEVTIGPLDDGGVYDSRVRFVGPSGGVTLWVVKEDVTVSASSASLTAPTITANPSSPSPSTNFNIEGTAPNSAEFWRLNIYRHTANDFGAATKVSTTYPAQDAAFAVVQNLAANNYWFWATAENLSGTEGTESSALAVTVA